MGPKRMSIKAIICAQAVFLQGVIDFRAWLFVLWQWLTYISWAVMSLAFHPFLANLSFAVIFVYHVCSEYFSCPRISLQMPPGLGFSKRCPSFNVFKPSSDSFPWACLWNSQSECLDIFRKSPSPFQSFYLQGSFPHQLACQRALVAVYYGVTTHAKGSWYDSQHSHTGHWPDLLDVLCVLSTDFITHQTLRCCCIFRTE